MTAIQKTGIAGLIGAAAGLAFAVVGMVVVTLVWDQARDWQFHYLRFIAPVTMWPIYLAQVLGVIPPADWDDRLRFVLLALECAVGWGLLAALTYFSYKRLSIRWSERAQARVAQL